MEEKMKKEFEELYGELYGAMEKIKKSKNRRRLKKDDTLTYTRFTAMQGYKFLNEEKPELRFLLVGRAVNGWGEYCGKDNSKESFIESSIANLTNKKDSFSKNKEGVKDRFEWIVTEENKPPHNTFREEIDSEDERNDRGKYLLTHSSFWNYTKDIFDKLNKTENKPWTDRWFENIAWTNLYKIAPTGKTKKKGKTVTWGANPNTTECKNQLEVCKKLLKAEIEYFKPTHILMVTGDWFDDFSDLFINIKSIGRNCNRSTNDKEVYLEKTAEYINENGDVCKVAVVCRPETRLKEAYVKEISDYFVNN